MASGFFKRAMVYLGLVDDEYDEYDEYEPRPAVGQRLSQRVSLAAEEEDEPTSAVATSTIRPLPREDFPTVTPTSRPAAWCVPSWPSPGHACTWWRRCSSAMPDRSPTGSWPISR